MQNNEYIYEQAEQEQKRLLAYFDSLKNLYGIIHHMRSRQCMTDKSAADFYQLLLDAVIGRNKYGVTNEGSVLDAKAFEEIINKCEGLFTYFEKGEKDKIINELKRLNG